MRAVRAIAVTALLCLTMPCAAVAQDTNASLTSIDTFLDNVVRYHPALKIMDTERRIAEARRLEKQGAFDPSFSLNSLYTRYNSATQLGVAKNATDSSASFDILTRSGMKLSAGGKLVAGSITPPLSPTGTGGEYFLEMKAPLLRGRDINPASAAEAKAWLTENLANAAFERQRLTFLTKAAETYWKWIGLGRKIVVEQRLLDLARTRTQAVAIQAVHGDVPSLAAVEATQELRKREGRMVKAKRDLQEASFDLSFYLSTPAGTPVRISPSTPIPALPAPVALDTRTEREQQAQALIFRPELRTLDISRRIASVDRKLAVNTFLPQVDFFINTGYETGRYAIGPTVRTGVSTMFPLRQRTATGQLNAAQLQLDKLSFEQTQFLRQVFLDVGDARSRIDATAQRYDLSVRELALAQQLERGERTAFALGDSTIFMVNQRERATADVELQCIDLQTEYQSATIGLRATVGRL